VLSLHGLAPFDAASLTGGWTSVKEQLLGIEDFTSPPRLLLSLPGALAVIGAITCVLRGNLLIPIWLPLVFVLIPRSAPSQGTVPLALLAAVGLGEVVVPGIRRAIKGGAAWHLAQLAIAKSRHSQRWLYAFLLVASTALAGLLTAVSFYWPRMHLGRHALDAVTPVDRQAMQWIAENTPVDSQFMVVSSRWAWEEDQVGEWFPVLAERRSLLTVQGAEWLPGELYERKICLRNKVRELAVTGKSIDDVDDWASGRGVPFTHIYVSTSLLGPIDWTSVTSTAVASPNYRVLWESSNAVVLERREPIKPRWEESGEFIVAPDCWSLADQPEETQLAFQAAYGPAAGRIWARDYYQNNYSAIHRRLGICDRVTRLGFSAASCGVTQ
jgi:hypothetical protein